MHHVRTEIPVKLVSGKQLPKCFLLGETTDVYENPPPPTGRRRWYRYYGVVQELEHGMQRNAALCATAA